MDKRLEEIILQIALEDYESGHTSASDKESFNKILKDDFNLEVGDEAFDFYAECRNMGPSGFYLMYKDELDFSSEFKAEYGFEEDEEEVEEIIEESLMEASPDEGSFKVQQIDSEGNKLDQFANFATADEAIAFAKTLKTPAEVIDNTLSESLKEEKVIWTNLDTLEEALSRDDMIADLKAKGKNYNFNKYTDAQIYRMHQREMNKKVVKPTPTLPDIDDEEDAEYIETSNCPRCNHQLTDAGQCPVCDLGDEEERSSHLLHLDENLFGRRVDPEVFEFKVGDRVAERWNDGEFNVGTITDIKEEEGTQYLVHWDYSDGPDYEWLYGDALTQWIEESLNEMKEVKTYKGYEMWADYDVDTEEGIISLIVHLYKNGKEVHQNEFGAELTFENFREARKWVDAHSSKCSLPDKLKQFCSIMNRKTEGDPKLSVDKDEYGYYISRSDGHNIEDGKIYFDDKYSYDYVYYHDPDIDWYEVAEYFGDNLDDVGIELKRDRDGASVGIESAPKLYDLRRDYFVPFDSSPLSTAIEFDGGLQALISISDWVFGEVLTDDEKEKLLDPYDCSLSINEPLNEEVLNEGPFKSKKDIEAAANKANNKEVERVNKLISNLGKILAPSYKDATLHFLVDDKWVDYNTFIKKYPPNTVASQAKDPNLRETSIDKYPELAGAINTVVRDRNGYIIRRGLELIKPKQVAFNPARSDLIVIKDGFKAEDIMATKEAPTSTSDSESSSSKKVTDEVSEKDDEATPVTSSTVDTSEGVTDKTIQNTINAAKVFGMNIYAMQGGDIKELNDAQLKNLGAGIDMNKIWVGKDNKTRVTLSQLANELKKKNIVESLDDELEYDNLEEKVVTHDSLHDGDMEELLNLAKEIGIHTMGELEEFAEREVPQGTSLIDTLRQYRDDLGDDFEVNEGFDGSPETEIDSYDEVDDISWFNR